MTDKHPLDNSPRAPRRAWRALGLTLVLLLPVSARAGATVRTRDAWFRYLLAAIPAGGYVTLRNDGAAPAVLTGATSPGCGMVMMHRTIASGGGERMVGVAQVTIPAHGVFRFAPGGYHLMCMDPRMHPGQTVPVTLGFADGSRITAEFAVRGANGAPMPIARMPAGSMPGPKP